MGVPPFSEPPYNYIPQYIYMNIYIYTIYKYTIYIYIFPLNDHCNGDMNDNPLELGPSLFGLFSDKATRGHGKPLCRLEIIPSGSLTV